jgi:small-conductance mechanosensitive channel
MRTITFQDAENLSICIGIITGGILITAFLDGIVKHYSLKAAKCACSPCYAHGGEWSRKFWQLFHTIFHVMHMLILFFSTWYAVRYILSEEAATKIFAGVAIGLGFAMQDVVKAVIAFFRITLSGEIVEGCSLTIDKNEYGKVIDICIFHVALEPPNGPKGAVVYLSTSKLLKATYTVLGKPGSGCGLNRSDCSTTINTGPGIPLIKLFNRRLVR